MGALAIYILGYLNFAIGALALYILGYLNFAIEALAVYILGYLNVDQWAWAIYILGYLNSAIGGSGSVHTWLFKLCYWGLWPCTYLVI